MDGTEEVYGRIAGVELGRGDRVQLITGNAGGYGNPHDRPREQVLADVKDGYTTVARAKAIYGVDRLSDAAE